MEMKGQLCSASFLLMEKFVLPVCLLAVFRCMRIVRLHKEKIEKYFHLDNPRSFEFLFA